MELAEWLRIVGAFLGGGLAKTLLDHLLADRAARRAALRPRYMERIEIVRRMLWTMYSQRSSPEHEEITDEQMLQVMGPALVELSDGRLLALWSRFIDRAGALSHMLPGDDLVARAKDKDHIRMEKAHQRMLNRLNKLERRR